MTAALRRVPPLFLFLGTALVVYATELLVVRSSAFAARPGVLAPAVAVDLAVFVPALYWLLVLRRGSGSKLGFLVVLALAWALAPAILPAPQRHYLRILLALAPLAEVAALGYAAGRVRRVVRAYRAWRGDRRDVLARLRGAFAEGLGEQLFWRALADELAVWRYACAPPPAPPAAHAGAFSYHRRSAWGAVVLAIALVGLVETGGVHLLVALWSPRAAWLLSFFSVYAVLWLVADLRACSRRPILLEDDLLLRVGLRWTARVPYGLIADASAARATGVPPRRAPGYLRATAFGSPTVLLELRGDVVAEGPYGMRRCVRRIGIAPDDTAAFLSALAARRPE